MAGAFKKVVKKPEAKEKAGPFKLVSKKPCPECGCTCKMGKKC